MSNPYGTSVAGALSFTVANDQNMRDSYVQQWNLNIQKKTFANIVVDVGYVGSKRQLIVTMPRAISRSRWLTLARQDSPASTAAARTRRTRAR